MSDLWSTNFRSGLVGDDSEDDGGADGLERSAYMRSDHGDPSTSLGAADIDEESLKFTETPFTIAARLAASRRNRGEASYNHFSEPSDKRPMRAVASGAWPGSPISLPLESTPPTSPLLKPEAKPDTSQRQVEHPALKPARVALEAAPSSSQLTLRFEDSMWEGAANDAPPQADKAPVHDEDQNLFAFDGATGQAVPLMAAPRSPPRKRARLGLNPRPDPEWSTLWASKLRGSAPLAKVQRGPTLSRLPQGLRGGPAPWSSPHHRSAASRKLRLPSIPGGQTAEERNRAIERQATPRVELFQPTPLAVEQRRQRESRGGDEGEDGDEDDIVWL